jgi:hypothetical protein
VDTSPRRRARCVLPRRVRSTRSRLASDNVVAPLAARYHFVIRFDRHRADRAQMPDTEWSADASHLTAPRVPQGGTRSRQRTGTVRPSRRRRTRGLGGIAALLQGLRSRLVQMNAHWTPSKIQRPLEESPPFRLPPRPNGARSRNHRLEGTGGPSALGTSSTSAERHLRQ